jgi:alpha-glucosidase
VHDIYREWRAVADSYSPPRVFVAEAWVDRPERLVMYLREDELHTAFNFDFLKAPWLAEDMRRTIEKTLQEHATVGAPATWVLSNHDVARHLSRYARPQRGQTHQLQELLDLPADLEVGDRRARAAALLMLALPGGAYVYQGEELGLPEVEDLPEDALQDPTWERSGHTDRGRDGCRVPLPWSGTTAPFGFGPDGSRPWLPQPASWAAHTAERQDGDPASMLNLYRAALRLRRQIPELGEGLLQGLATDGDVLSFRRSPRFVCVTNFGATPVALPDGQVLLTSIELDGEGRLPGDATAWLLLAD